MQQATAEMSVPGGIDSPRAKLVYLYLTARGGATVGELRDDLGMKKLTLYSVLDTLRERELVGEESDRYVPAVTASSGPA